VIIKVRRETVPCWRASERDDDGGRWAGHVETRWLKRMHSKWCRDQTVSNIITDNCSDTSMVWQWRAHDKSRLIDDTVSGWRTAHQTTMCQCWPNATRVSVSRNMSYPPADRRELITDRRSYQ